MSDQSPRIRETAEAPEATLGVHAQDDGRPLPARGDDEASRAEAEQARAFAVASARALSDGRCTDVLVFDVRDLSQVTDYLVIASGTSDRQMMAAARDVADVAREIGIDRYGDESDDGKLWLVQDYVTVVIHLFEPVTRGHYDLEMMWGDAPMVRWRREGDAPAAERA